MKSNDVSGVNTVYILSLILPIAVTVFLYYRKRRISRKEKQ
jgi:hypothetical protein